MSTECFPISVLPHVSRLYGDYLAMAELPAKAPLRSWYGADPVGGTGVNGGWMGRQVKVSEPDVLADLLAEQSKGFSAGEATLANVEKLRGGARAVVTGQQVGLFGGPLLTLLKAATAVARAAEATRATGVEHVPVFWLATEDHDLAEVNQATLLGKYATERLAVNLRDAGAEVGGAVLGEDVEAALERVRELLGYAPVCELLAECYAPGRTLADAFGRWMTALFSSHGLIVMDACGREFHRLGAPALRRAVTHAAQLEAELLQRTTALEEAGYHAQVLVKPGASLLFLIDESTGRRDALRRSGEAWKAGGASYSTGDLLAILDATPERLSPNALLRPVFQDTILPTAAYIGGPAEVAYFAQSEVLYAAMLERVTPVLPRFSATLTEPAIAAVMARHEVTLDQVFAAQTVEAMAQRLGARAMPIEGKRKLAAAGNAVEAELSAATEYLTRLDASLGRSAEVAASKMRYQMGRLRRLAATFEVQKEASLVKHSRAMLLHLLPDAHPQERITSGVQFLALREDLIELLVKEAGQMCVGHAVIRL